MTASHLRVDRLRAGEEPTLIARLPSGWAVLADAALLGDALLAVTGATRINCAIFGNLEAALHVHVVPRYAHESAELCTAQPWDYDWNAAPRFDAQRDALLLSQLRTQLARLMAK